MAFADGTPLPRTGLVLPDRDDLSAADAIALAERAEAAGIESIWAWEGWGYNPFALLGRLAERIDCPLGTGIVNAYAYTPAALATATVTLHDATDGQFVLGVGASTPPIVEGLHGASFERPVRRLRECFEILDLAFAGERLDYDGEFFDLQGFALQHTPIEVPVFNAALGPLNTAMTVEFADGLMPNLLPFDAIPEVVAAAEDRAGEASSIHVAPQVPACVSAADSDAARHAVARDVASYVGGVDAYHAAMANNGFEDAASTIREHWKAGERDAATEAVTDELLDAVAVAGSPEHARKRLAALLDGPVDTALLTFPGGADETTMEETVETLGSV